MRKPFSGNIPGNIYLIFGNYVIYKGSYKNVIFGFAVIGVFLRLLFFVILNKKNLKECWSFLYLKKADNYFKLI